MPSRSTSTRSPIASSKSLGSIGLPKLRMTLLYVVKCQKKGWLSLIGRTSNGYESKKAFRCELDVWTSLATGFVGPDKLGAYRADVPGIDATVAWNRCTSLGLNGATWTRMVVSDRPRTSAPELPTRMCRVGAWIPRSARAWRAVATYRSVRFGLSNSPNWVARMPFGARWCRLSTTALTV